MKFLQLLLFSLLFFPALSKAQCFSTEQEFKNYFENNIGLLDPIEGIWEVKFEPKHFWDGSLIYVASTESYYTGAIVSNGTNFSYCFWDAIAPSSTSTFTKTSDKGSYILNKYENSELKYIVQVKITNEKTLQYTYTSKDYDPDFIIEYLFEKVKNRRPKANEIQEARNHITSSFSATLTKIYPTGYEPKVSRVSSGTGFAVTNSGYVVTNYHVVENAKKLTIRGVDGNFNSGISATIVATDKNNDLAIIKLDNNNSISGSIPYTLCSKNSSVGENVFALGYPLRATMGDEVKLTNGIISANSGYQGDITKYQISVPVQPGNSGGPLMTYQGYLTGIINAKHLETENVSYAVKITYLESLISSLPDNIALPKINLLSGKTLSEQTQLVKKYVYIIEAE